MNILAMDIETMPNPAMIEFLPEVKPDPRLKDPEKIEADIAKKQEEQIDKMALNPLYGQIACIGYYGEDYKEVDLQAEKNMIETVLQRSEDYPIFTWNGKGFDYEFIIKRGVILGLCSLLDLEKFTDKYKAVNHIDLMEKWAGYNKYVKLQEVSTIILGEGKEEDFDVKDIPKLIKTKSGQELIKRYCLTDCKRTYELAKKFGF